MKISRILVMSLFAASMGISTSGHATSILDQIRGKTTSWQRYESEKNNPIGAVSGIKVGKVSAETKHAWALQKAACYTNANRNTRRMQEIYEHAPNQTSAEKAEIWKLTIARNQDLARCRALPGADHRNPNAHEP